MNATDNNKDWQIERYLGTMSPDKFDSIEEIENYFSKENIVHMFGPDSFNEEEAEKVKEFVLDEWNESDAIINDTIKEKRIQKFANSFARKHNWGRATTITISEELTEPTIGETTQFGWRKNTTGEYVSHAYRRKFGWKNTYYQHAECEVILPLSMVEDL